jgi:hypothetical protein
MKASLTLCFRSNELGDSSSSKYQSHRVVQARDGLDTGSFLSKHIRRQDFFRHEGWQDILEYIY